MLEQRRVATIQRAITSIVVDSFSHNVGAHCLVALAWWFEIRANITRKRFDTRKIKLEALQPSTIPQKTLKEAARNISFEVAANPNFDQKQDSHHEQYRTSLLQIIHHMHKDEKIFKQFLRFYDSNEYNQVARMPVSLDYALYPFFQSMRNKSAFWSGVARDLTFSGMVKGWLEVLNEFVQNSLFLGTITHSEGINRINIHLEIWEPNKGKWYKGEFAQINLEVIYQELLEEGRTDYESLIHDTTGDIRYSPYAFVRKGRDFNSLTRVLKNLEKVFLPNGVIGQQALYTILENTLRNIKHYQNLEEIRKSGVHMCISIKEVPFIPRYGYPEEIRENSPKPLYRIGTWLHHEQDLHDPEIEKNSSDTDEAFVIVAHNVKLKQRIVNRHGMPRLGGSAQDKSCACLLMNNTFLSIDAKSTDKWVKRHYFPYIFPASENFTTLEERKIENNPNIDFLTPIYNEKMRLTKDDIDRLRKLYKIHDKEEAALQIQRNRRIFRMERRKKFDTAVSIYKDATRKRPKGIVKKYFHVWKSEECLTLKQKINAKNDNLARYTLAIIPPAKDIDFEFEETEDFISSGKNRQYQENLPLPQRANEHLRNQGIVRIISQDTAMKIMDQEGDENLLIHALSLWLKDWLKKRNALVLHQLNDDPLGLLYIDIINTVPRLIYLNQSQINDSPEILSSLNIHPIVFAHAAEKRDEGAVSIRRHGSFLREFFPKHGLGVGELVHLSKATMAPQNEKESEKDFNKKRALLLETILTRITVFDNRIHNRIPQQGLGGKAPVKVGSRTELLDRMLNLQVFPEDKKMFQQNLLQILKASHILILHLSFIEMLRSTQGIRYKEVDVRKFFKEQLKDPYEAVEGNGPFPKNFLLIVTSGRGSTDWFEAIKEPQISFRPIEDITTAIDNGLVMNDDFQVKYNLSKVIFGS